MRSAFEEVIMNMHTRSHTVSLQKIPSIYLLLRILIWKTHRQIKLQRLQKVQIYGSPNVAILSELNIYFLGKIYGQCENLILIICKENIWTVKKKKCSSYYFSLMRSNVLFQQIKCAIQYLYPFCLLWKFFILLNFFNKLI